MKKPRIREKKKIGKEGRAGNEKITRLKKLETMWIT